MAQKQAVQALEERQKIVYQKVQHDHDALKKQNETQTSELVTLQHSVMELKLNIQSRDEKIASLEDIIGRANDKIETLRHENLFALQEKASLEGQLKQMVINT